MSRLVYISVSFVTAEQPPEFHKMREQEKGGKNTKQAQQNRKEINIIKSKKVLGKAILWTL